MQDRPFPADDSAAPPPPSAPEPAERRRTVPREPRATISTGRWMWEWTKAVSTAILLFLTVRTFLVEAFKIPTGSMEGTLLIGDFLLVNKAVYGAEIPLTDRRLPAFARPGRGDVVVFLPPHDPHKNYVKRIVGAPGDTLEMRDKVLLRNGQPQDEPYARHTDPLGDQEDPKMLWQLDFTVDRTLDWRSYHPSRDNWGPIVVPPGKFFALGDNRDRSEDSRYWGFLDAGSIKGRPMFVYYSFENDITRPLAWATSVRWGRIGEIIH
ncbi:MAG TPA: signal peptidase I [Longimicrobium sp.]|nr:signal peptidase I [Longimicrobium sp.]